LPKDAIRMFELSLSTLLPSLTMPGAAANPASAGGFSVALADLIGVAVDPTPGPVAPIIRAALAAPGRQVAAADGKSLPDDPAIQANPIDPALAWLGLGTIAMEIVAPTTSAPAPVVPAPKLPAPKTADAAPVARAVADPAEPVIEIAAMPIMADPAPSIDPLNTEKKASHAKRDPTVPSKQDAAVAPTPATPAPIVAGPVPPIPAVVTTPTQTDTPEIAAAVAVPPAETPIVTRAEPRAADTPTRQISSDILDSGAATVATVPVERSVPREGSTAGQQQQQQKEPHDSISIAPPNMTKPDGGAIRADARPPRAGSEPVRVAAAAAAEPGKPQPPVAALPGPAMSPRLDGASAAPLATTVTRADAAPPPAMVSREPVRSESAPPAQPPQPAPAPAAARPTAPQPAGMVFGFALAGAVGQRQPADAADRAAPRAEALQALSAAAGSAQAICTVTAAGDPRHAALDMRRDDWPQAMIDRIEALRDSADAANTRIRLIPDALGKVDVSLRHDGDAVHVHFTADVAATRTLIADAQPRLAEAAQARGLRLGQATVDAGGGGAGRQPPQQHQPATSSPIPARPAPASAADAGALPESSRLA